MNTYTVRVLSQEAGKWYSEGEATFSTRDKAERYAREVESDGYAYVIRQGNRLRAHRGIDAKGARIYGASAVVGRLI